MDLEMAVPNPVAKARVDENFKDAKISLLK
jgi:hypothetical protein